MAVSRVALALAQRALACGATAHAGRHAARGPQQRTSLVRAASSPLSAVARALHVVGATVANDACRPAACVACASRARTCTHGSSFRSGGLGSQPHRAQGSAPAAAARAAASPLLDEPSVAALSAAAATAGRPTSDAPKADGAAPGASSPPAATAGALQLDDIIITPSAARRLAALQARAAGAGGDPRQFALRVRVDGGGCSGFKYSFELERAAPTADDRVFAVGDARVVVDAVSLDLVRGSTLDWVDEMMRNCFALVNNPQSASSCGCGSSFAAKE